jgi:CHASE2 domain-containing sensor protein
LIALATAIIGFFALRHGLNRNVIGGLFVGFLVAGAWSITAVLGSDEFDPMAPMSLSFVAPIGEAMTYLQLASGLEPSFNVTLVLGVLIGAFVSSIVRGEFQLQTFETARDHARYFLGAALMGVGGILALGCNTGQAITGLATGSLWSILVTAVIFVSGYWMHRRIIESI